MILSCLKILHKHLIINILISIFVSICSVNCYSQVFGSDQNPPHLKWRQINTENFQIIYPTELNSQSQQLANTLEKAIQYVQKSLNKQPKKISIILQNQGTTSNGFVQLAPRRSEFFTTASQNFDYQNWINSLAVHELRHVVQFDKLTGRFNTPPLESIGLAIFGINLPPWLYEGDAVVTETALTNAGRGRLPEWAITLRTNTLNQKKYSYSKDYFGSVKDFTPGYYQLGFFMNSKLRLDYGEEILDHVFTRISKLPIRPYNLSNSIKKFAGYTANKLHTKTIEELETLWKSQINKVSTEHYVSLNKRKDNTPEHFLLPVAISSHKIIYLKESKAATPALCVMDSAGQSKKILNIGLQENSWFNYADSKIVWDEMRYDTRYQQRSFNVINLYDLKTGKARQLTHKSRLFAPVLSPDTKKVMTVEVSTSNLISIVEINTTKGTVLRRYPSPNNYMLQMPAYNLSGNKAVMVAIANTGKMIYELDLRTGNFKEILPLQLQEILHPVYANDQLIFKAHYNGIDNLYRLNPQTKEVYQISSVPYGAFNPSFDNINNRVLFNNYTVVGHDITAIPWKPTSGINVTKIKNTYVNYAAPLAAQEGNKNIFDSIPTKQYEVKPYKELNNLFYFHSINPIWDTNISGLELQSDNKLNTLSVYTGYQFNSSLHKSEYTAGFAYKRYYPIISINYINRARLINRRSVVNGQTVFSPVTWRENETKAEVNIPFLFNRFNTTYNAGFKTGTSYTNRYNVDKPFAALIDKISFPMHYQVYAGTSTRRSARDLGPRWAQSATFTYRHFPFEKNITGTLLLLQSNFFFPGIQRNHSLQASFNWQDGDGNYQNTVDIPRVSGYSYLKPSANPSNTLFLNYRFPLFYPDWELGPIAYIKRIKAGFFADFEDVGHHNAFAPRSYGAELRSDMNLLRFYLPNFDLGAKIIFLNEKPQQKPIFELITTYNF